MKGMICILILLSVICCSCSTIPSQNPDENTLKINLIKSGELVYPVEAQINKYEGNVDLLLLVDTDGKVKTSKVVYSSGYYVLDTAALHFTNNILFEPIIWNDKPVAKWIKWRVNFSLFNVSNNNGGARNIKVLVYTKTNGNRPESIKDGIKMFKQLSDDYHFVTNFTEDSTAFSDKNLSNYDVIVFLNTKGNVLGEDGKEALKKFVNNGGGFVGIHSASQTETQWEWYNRMIGYRDIGNPEMEVATISVVDKNNPSTENLPAKWSCENEWHQWKKDNSVMIDLLLSRIGDDNFDPVSWCHEYDGGRAWYTNIGYSPENFRNPSFQQHVLGGIIWAAGN